MLDKLCNNVRKLFSMTLINVQNNKIKRLLKVCKTVCINKLFDPPWFSSLNLTILNVIDISHSYFIRKSWNLSCLVNDIRESLMIFKFWPNKLCLNLNIITVIIYIMNWTQGNSFCAAYAKVLHAPCTFFVNNSEYQLLPFFIIIITQDDC